MDKKAFVAKYSGLVALACGVRNLPSRLRTRKKGTGNLVQIRCALLRGCHIHIRGNNNRVIVEDFSQLKLCPFTSAEAITRFIFPSGAP